MEEYCLEFTLSGKEIVPDKLTKALAEVGHQLTIDKEGEGEYKVHIHAPDPKKVFDRTSRFGKPAHIKVNEHSCDRKD